MVAPRHRAHTFRKVKRKAPGGRVVTHYEPRKPKKAHCAGCGAQLQGVPRLKPIQLGKLAKSEKRPERPYGGVLCSACMRQYFKAQVRMQ